MDAIRNLALLAGRIMLSGVFIYDATLVFRFPEPNAAFLADHGVPSILLLPAGALQLIAGIFVAVGLWTRLAALALAGFSVTTALIFHRDFGQVSEIVQFGKDIAIAGGFLALAAAGAGRWSTDAYREG
jgi:putative oxidoreductase